MASAIVESQNVITARRKSLGAIFQEYPDLNMPEEKATEVKRLNDELAELCKKHDNLVAMQTAKELNEKAMSEYMVPDRSAGGFRLAGGVAGEGEDNPQRRAGEVDMKALANVGHRIIDSAEYKSAHSKAQFTTILDNVSVKTLMVEGGPGYAPANPRTNIVVPSAQPRPVVADLIPQSDTNLQAIRYMVETTFTNNATTVSEGAVKPESALAFQEQVSPVQVIATFIPVTMQQLEDVPGLEDLVNQRLTLMLLLAEETQLLSGNGVSPNLTGLLNTSGVQVQAKGVDPGPDAIYKAMTKVRFTGFADPSGIVLNPTDWQNIRLLRTADGVYIWGSPAESGIERIWGLPIIQTVNEPVGTAFLGDFRMYSHISRRMGIRIDVSNSHSDFFVRNQLAIRIEERLSLEVYRPAAFCKVTGL